MSAQLSDQLVSAEGVTGLLVEQREELREAERTK